MSGASVWQVLCRVTLKLTWPAIFASILILFVRSIESFEVPALLGPPVGIEVFTSSIYTAVHRYPSQVGLASAYGVALLVITTVGVYAVSRLSSKGSKYATMTGKGFRPRQIDLGTWRWLTASVFIAHFRLIVVLPFLVLLWSSFQRFYTVPSRDALRNLALDPYRFVFSYPDLASTVWNSLLLLFGGQRGDARHLGDLLAGGEDEATGPMAPRQRRVVAPGVSRNRPWAVDHDFYLNVDIGIYGTIWIMFIVVHHALYAVWPAVQHDLDGADSQGARRIRGDVRRVLDDDVSQDCAAAVEAGSDGGLDLRDDCLRSRTLDVHPAGQSGHACGVDRDLGTGERAIRGVVGARRAVHPVVVRARLFARWVGGRYGIRE